MSDRLLSDEAINPELTTCQTLNVTFKGSGLRFSLRVVLSIGVDLMQDHTPIRCLIGLVRDLPLSSYLSEPGGLPLNLHSPFSRTDAIFI